MLKIKKANAEMGLEEIRNQIKEGEPLYLKFVRINGQYRFCDATDFSSSHSSLAQNQPVESAGFVKIFPKKPEFYIEGYSSILKIGWDEKDESNLQKLLGLSLVSMW